MAVGTSFFSCPLCFCISSSDKWMICNFLIVFLLIEFHCNFPYLIKYYHVMFISIVFWLINDRPSGPFFFRTRFTSFLTHAYLFTFFVRFCIFHSCCSHARVFVRTLVHESPFFIALLNSTFFRETRWSKWSKSRLSEINYNNNNNNNNNNNPQEIR